jgi:hypothetical protein
MRGVIVVNDHDVAVRIVTADVTPIEGASAHDKYEERRDGAIYGSLTRGA